MTTKEKFISMLVACGMFESQAEEVMLLARPIIEEKNALATGILNEESGEIEDFYQISWDGEANGYGIKLYNFWFNTTIKPVALKWIDQNKPQAWFRAMFI